MEVSLNYQSSTVTVISRHDGEVSSVAATGSQLVVAVRKSPFHSRSSRRSASTSGTAVRPPSVWMTSQTVSAATERDRRRNRRRIPDDSRQKLFDPRIEYVTRDGLRFDQQAVIGKQHFLPVLILRLADQVTEDAALLLTLR